MDSAVDACLRKAVEGRVVEARRTYPEIRARFLSGLPSGHMFFVTTRIHDKEGRFEQAFVFVDSLHGKQIFGRIASDMLLPGFHRRQAYNLDEADVIDWTVAKPDGTEDGNYLGKYMDSLLARLSQGGIPKPC
jgi:hypothetical protein